MTGVPHRDGSDRRQVLGWTAVLVLLALVTWLHYTTSFHLHGAHGIYRRLYYFPIVIAAFLGGWRGGLGVALLACLLYLPHSYGLIGFDPAPTLEKNLEMVLYLAIGLLSGLLVEKEQRALAASTATAADLRRALAEKEAMEQELIQAERLAAVGLLSAGLAHEIRNPLASIKGATEILADDSTTPETRQRLLSILRRETDRLNDVLTRFLAFARPARGERSVFDLTEEVRQVAELLGRQEGTAATLVVRASAPVPVRGDRDQIRQAVWNLVLNASQFAGSSGRVTVTVERHGDRAVVQVADDGPGFPPASLAQLGTPFHSTRQGGSGLGLAVAVRVANDHGGRLTASNRPSGGAEVTLELPAEVSDGQVAADRR